MKIYKIAFNVSKDDLLASKLSKEVFNIVKENIGKHIYKEIDIDGKIKLALNVYKNQENYELRYKTFDINGSLDYSNIGQFSTSMQINITFSDDFSESNFNKLNFVLYNSIRHELSHYHQYKNGNIEENIPEPPTDLLDYCIKLKNYISHRNEIDPYINGIVFEYKKEGGAFNIILDRSLNELIFNDDPLLKSKAQRSKKWTEINSLIIELKNMLINRAKQLYPHLRNQ